MPNTGTARYDAHNSIRDEIIACAVLANLRAGPHPPALAQSDSGRETGDLIIDFPKSYARGTHGPAKNQFWNAVIGDVTLVHVRNGNVQDPSQWGTWDDRKISEAIKEKERHYKPYEHNSTLCFVAMAISTYGNMCDDLLRLLWLIAEAQFDLAARRGAVDVDTDWLHQIKILAARLRSRIACAAAVGVAKRLACLPKYDFRHAKTLMPSHPLDYHFDEPLFPC